MGEHIKDIKLIFVYSFFQKLYFHPMEAPYIIGITGGSGSGKTSLLKMLRDEFSPGELAILTQDNY